MKKQRQIRILFTGGGTGGHFFPILAIAQEIEKLFQEKNITNYKFLLIGSGKSFKKMAQENSDLKYKSVLSGKIRRYITIKSIVQNLIDFFKMPIGILQAFWKVWIFMPNACFGKGGFASFPAVLVSWIYRIPIIIHESDTVPGLANRILSKFSTKVAIGYSNAKKYFKETKIIFTSNPVREELLQGSKEQAIKFFQLNPEKQTILVLGGSLGARAINDLLIYILPNLQDYNIIHQYGNRNQDQIRGMQNIRNYNALPFLKQEIAHAYAISDLIISRAGANILAEIAALKKPSILIPLPTSSFDHQRENAMVFAKNDAAIVLEQENLRPNILLEKIKKLLYEKELSRKIGEHAHELARLDAGKKIAQEILKISN
ncbi:undecaprenyldiphospho-muramoylpentapeptide beta-N-acetylglucosaminyltransferase [bacterium]|nr:undecaprenyldiphospho-muramoylpentapeptide beta-N-acetylglucosaminyltransferase [bacterium]|tara:strand:- start:6119 stop:7240 length:1122 start_codon:yes stop_codon:yes gene_type:complete